jgi:hypothetical protein
MTDDKRADPVGTVRHIDLADEQGLQLWSIVLGVFVPAILTAVEAVGTEARAVQVEIEAHPSIYGRPSKR